MINRIPHLVPESLGDDIPVRTVEQNSAGPCELKEQSINRPTPKSENPQ